MRIKLLVSIALLLCIWTPEVFASDFETADSAYSHGRYQEAILLYEAGMEKEGLSAGTLYNLGNAYLQAGKEGEARLCYERAHRLEPGNQLIRQNLNYLTAKITEANRGNLNGKEANVEPDRETFLQTLYRIIAVDRQSNGWAAFAVMAFILFLGGVALYVFTPNVLARKTGFFSGLTFLGFTIIFIIFAFMGAHRYEKQDEVVLLQFNTELLKQPESKAAPASSPLYKGTKLKIVETKQGADGQEWLKVRLNSEFQGWIKSSDAEII